MTWRLVNKKTRIVEELVIFYKSESYFHGIDVYLPAFLRRRIHNFEQYKWVNIYREGSKFLFQFCKSSTSPHTRKVAGHKFTLPWREFKNYWNNGLKRMGASATIEKNDIIVDLRDLRGVDEYVSY